MKEEQQPQKREVKKTQYYLKCPECGKEIKGTSKIQLAHNIMVHNQLKHTEEVKQNE